MKPGIFKMCLKNLCFSKWFWKLWERAHIFQTTWKDMFCQTHFENTRYHVFKMAPNQGFKISWYTRGRQLLKTSCQMHQFIPTKHFRSHSKCHEPLMCKTWLPQGFIPERNLNRDTANRPNHILRTVRYGIYRMYNMYNMYSMYSMHTPPTSPRASSVWD